MPKRRSDELAAIDGVMPLVDRFNELEHAQRLIFLDMVDPLPEEVAPTGKPTKTTTKRKIERCEVCNYTRRALQHVNPQHTEYHEFVKAEKARKKSSTSKSSQSSSKSPRASGIHAQLKERRQEQREPMTTKDDNYDPEAERCTFVRGDGKLCYLLSDHNVHHMKTHPEYHEFESGKSAAPPAPVRSPANGEGTSSTQNLEASAVSAGAATGGSNND